ncbi:MAG: NPCBM/NEW2 domain-containing protein [Planctomycetes bacterium]|nr:NPCBM/NEW2 domain-containing protein [Planctomycetota bacterium]
MLGSFLSCAAVASSRSWHVPDAVLKFTIEADPNRPTPPGIHVSGRKDTHADWNGSYYRIDGKTYKGALAMTCPGQATYGCKEEYRRFTALIGVREDAGDTAAIVFEVAAGTRKLYSSPPLTKFCPPIGIDVRLPPKTTQIVLTAKGSGSEGHHWAGWVDAGFPTRDDRARVGCVTLPVPGFDPAQYEAVMFTSNGLSVGSRRLATRDGQIDLLFFAGQGWSTYYVYWVRTDRFMAPAKTWEPDAGLVLETRRIDKSRQRECEDPAGMAKVWNAAGPAVGRSLVLGVHHGYPVHPLLLDAADNSAAKGVVALYRYTGFFEADRAGSYLFATASNGGSHLLVDDQPVVSWPGNHDYRQGIRGQKQGKVTLEPGVHRLDYFNYGPWGTMLALAAWQPPGGKFGVMTGNDFSAVRGFVATGVESSPAEDKVSFDWDVVDDWRLDPTNVVMVRMRFRALPDRRLEDKGRKTESGKQKTEDGKQKTEPSSVVWTFDDGITRTGRTVERVFLSPGRHTVKVQITRDNEVLAETSQAFLAAGAAEKIWAVPRDPEAFQKGIAQFDFRTRPIQEAVRLYTLGAQMQEPVWKNAAEQVLLERATELMTQPSYYPLCLELIAHLCMPALQRYEQALDLYTKLRARTREGSGSPVRQQTMVLEGELWLRCLGKPDAALALLNQARWEKAQDKTSTIRHGLARAEALLALNQQEELAQQMRQLADLQKPQDAKRQELRHAGLLHEAQSLVNVARLAQPKSAIQDPPSDRLAPLDTAMDNLQTILNEDPQQVLSPGWNRVRLDIHLGRGEYRMARSLAERLAHLEMTPYDRAEVLVRHVEVLCALGEPDAARKVWEDLTRVFPNSEHVSQARATLVEAATRTRARQP